MPSYDFPSNPSTNDTHTIGDKTWTFNGSAWEKTFSGDSIQIVGVSDFDGVGISGETFANTNELSFRSLTPGLTLSASQTANRTLLTWDALDIASRIGVLSTSWTYTSAADISIPSAGNIRHQTGAGRLAINQVDSGGSNTRTTWATVRDDIENYGTSIIRLSFGDDERNYTVNAASYVPPVWNFTISEGNDQTSGTGKSVNAGGYVNPGQNTKVSASEFYRFPDGTTTETVVTSFNGETGDVTTTSTVLPVAGISASGGATFGGIIHAPGLTLGPGGVTFPDGTNMKTAAAGGGGIEELNGSTAAGITLAQGFRYKVSAVAASPSSPSAGEIAIKDFLGAGLIPSGFKLHKNPRNSVIDLSFNSGNDESYFKRFADSGGILTITNEKTGKSAQFIDTANFTSSSNILEYSANAKSYDATSALASVGDFVIVQLDFYTDAGVTSIGGTAFQNKGALSLGRGITAENAGGGTGRLRLEQETIGFIIDGAGSPLGTGDKLDALRQVPYGMEVDSTSAFIPAGVSGTDKTITFSIKKTSTLASLSASDGITGTKLILGNTASANQTGFTFDGVAGGIIFRELGSASSNAGATVDKNEWVFPEITGNSGDINKLQIFMKLKPQD